jgi:hypothetical protein
MEEGHAVAAFEREEGAAQGLRVGQVSPHGVGEGRFPVRATGGLWGAQSSCDGVDAVPQASGEGIEVGQGDHQTAVGKEDAGRLVDEGGLVSEVVQGALAEHALKGGLPER